MKRCIAAIALAVFTLAPCLAEEGDLDTRLKSVEESLDQMKRDKAEESAPNLTQSLDWGSGWALGVNMGTELSDPAVGIDVLSPIFLKNFRVGFTNFAWFDHNYPEPITSPDKEYITTGMLAGLRVIYTSPLFFNFTRLYCGFGYDYAVLVGMGDASAIAAGSPPVLQKTTTEIFCGIDLFVRRNMSAYLEFVPQLTPLSFGGVTVFEWLSEGDEAYFNAVNTIPGWSNGVTLKTGLRFYF
jgi:hypothetical protein